jgi:hypothetical protein
MKPIETAKSWSALAYYKTLWTRSMSGYIIQIASAHDPLKPAAWLAEPEGTALRVVYDRNQARVFETAAEAHKVAARHREVTRLRAEAYLVRQRRRAV